MIVFSFLKDFSVTSSREINSKGIGIWIAMNWNGCQKRFTFRLLYSLRASSISNCDAWSDGNHDSNPARSFTERERLFNPHSIQNNMPTTVSYFFCVSVDVYLARDWRISHILTKKEEKKRVGRDPSTTQSRKLLVHEKSRKEVEDTDPVFSLKMNIVYDEKIIYVMFKTESSISCSLTLLGK